MSATEGNKNQPDSDISKNRPDLLTVYAGNVTGGWFGLDKLMLDSEALVPHIAWGVTSNKTWLIPAVPGILLIGVGLGYIGLIVGQWLWYLWMKQQSEFINARFIDLGIFGAYLLAFLYFTGWLAVFPMCLTVAFNLSPGNFFYVGPIDEDGNGWTDEEYAKFPKWYYIFNICLMIFMVILMVITVAFYYTNVVGAARAGGDLQRDIREWRMNNRI